MLNETSEFNKPKKSKVSLSPRLNLTNLLDTRTEAPRTRIGMVVDVPETNILAEFLSVVNGNANGRCTLEYCRPEFLHFSTDEIQLSSDKSIRPVLCPKMPLPAYAGYAEVINCGKSEKNEDMAAASTLKVTHVGFTAEKAIELSEPTHSSLMDSLNERQSSRQNAAKLVLGTGNITAAENRDHLADDKILRLSRSFSSEDGISNLTADLSYFAVFDGHAGSATAIFASKYLQEHIKVKLSEVLESVLLLHDEELLRKSCSPNKESSFEEDNRITADNLVIGALESAFIDMDAQIAAEKAGGRLPGGCAVTVALFFLNKIFVANAGDCRALLISPGMFRQLSTDFAPSAERKRLQSIAARNHEAIANSFSRLEYSRHLSQKDLNAKVLYRDWYMDGWACKTVRQSDLKASLITRGKKSRLLNTIGLSRALGDHNLMTVDDKIAIKPFLSPCPEVCVFDTRSMDLLTERDVLILATDGFWDVLSNSEVFQMVNASLSPGSPHGEQALENDAATRYTLLAQELAAAARGHPIDNCRWKLSNGGMASHDDITIFVIPLKFAIDASATINTDNDDEDILMA